MNRDVGHRELPRRSRSSTSRADEAAARTPRVRIAVRCGTAVAHGESGRRRACLYHGTDPRSDDGRVEERARHRLAFRPFPRSRPLRAVFDATSQRARILTASGSEVQSGWTTSITTSRLLEHLSIVGDQNPLTCRHRREHGDAPTRAKPVFCSRRRSTTTSIRGVALVIESAVFSSRESSGSLKPTNPSSARTASREVSSGHRLPFVSLASFAAPNLRRPKGLRRDRAGRCPAPLSAAIASLSHPHRYRAAGRLRGGTLSPWPSRRPALAWLIPGVQRWGSLPAPALMRCALVFSALGALGGVAVWATCAARPGRGAHPLYTACVSTLAC